MEERIQHEAVIDVDAAIAAQSQQSVVTDSATDTVETVEVAAPEQPVAVDNSKQEQKKEAEQARNFKAMREAAERVTRERDEVVQRLQEYERRYANQPQPNYAVANEPDTDFEGINLKDDELAEGQHLKKIASTIKKLEAKQKALEQQSYTSNAEVRLRSQFSDFDKVMTLQNVQTFSAAYPELAKSINASSDLYDKAVSAYTLIKRFGIYDEEPYQGDKVRALENTAKPRPLASVSPQQGESPLSRANAFANGLTEELKKKLREEMAAASRKC